jgi:Na+/H+-dicarboxylate symporter
MQLDKPAPIKSVSNRDANRIMVALVIGIVAGLVCNRLAPSPDAAKNIAGYFAIITDIFLRMIKMVIAPLVFATIVSGIAELGSSGGAVGRITFRAMSWFVTASLISLSLGLIFANLIAPGKGLGLPLPSLTETTNLQAGAVNLKDFAAHVFPSSIVQAMASNEVLQIVVFSIFLGAALSALGTTSAKTITTVIREFVPVMLKVTDFVMRFAPLGVFAAIAAVVAVQGVGILVTYSKFIGTFYLASAVLWMLLIAAGLTFLGRSALYLIKLLQEPMVIAFSTASSEAAFPRMLEQLLKFGVKERVSAFVLPLAYSFNLDGSMVYQAVATLFVAQVVRIGRSQSCARQIANRLMGWVGNPYRREFASSVQPGQVNGVPPIGFDPAAGFARNQRRCHDDAFPPGFAQLALNSVAARARLIAKPRLGAVPRQFGTRRLQHSRRTRDLRMLPNFDSLAYLGKRHSNGVFVHVKADVDDRLLHDRSPMHEARRQFVQRDPRTPAYCKTGRPISGERLV